MNTQRNWSVCIWCTANIKIVTQYNIGMKNSPNALFEMPCRQDEITCSPFNELPLPTTSLPLEQIRVKSRRRGATKYTMGEEEAGLQEICVGKCGSLKKKKRSQIFLYSSQWEMGCVFPLLESERPWDCFDQQSATEVMLCDLQG